MMYILSSDFTKFDDEWTFDHPSPLKGILLRVKKEVRSFGNDRSTATIFKLVVMDGSNNVFLCALNSGLSKKFIDVNLSPGATICLTDYKWISFEPPDWKDGTLARSLCLVDKLEVNDAPTGFGVFCDDESAVTLEYSSTILDEEVIINALDYQHIVFTYPVHEDKYGAYIFGLMSVGDVITAQFIPDKQMRRKFIDVGNKVKKRRVGVDANSPAQSPDKPACSCHKHGIMDCVLDVYPLHAMDEDVLYEQINHRLMGKVYCEWFYSLSPSHKRWAYYWWYSVNIFHVKSGRKELPACFLYAVRQLYPNTEKADDFTGFKEIGEE